MGYGVGRVAYHSLRGGLTVWGNCCLHVNRIPAGCDPPTIRVSDRESAEWASGAVFDWANELFPPEHRDEMHWGTSTHRPPAVILKRPGRAVVQ